MHARPSFWSIAILIAITTGVTGCRGARSLGSFVHVKAEPSGSAPEIEAPPQRLATANSSAPGETKTAPVEAKDSAKIVRVSASMDSPGNSNSYSIGDRSDSVAQQNVAETVAQPSEEKGRSSTRRTEKLLSMQPKKQTAEAHMPPPTKETDPKSDSQAKSSASRVQLSDRDRSSRPAAASVAEHPSTEKAVAKSDPADDSGKEALDAFSTSSPEIQQQALRQLLAMAARRAQQSTQPSSIDELLKEAMANPIALPDPVRSPPSKKTTRLASANTTTKVHPDKTDQREQPGEANAVPEVHVAAVESSTSQASNQDSNETASMEKVGDIQPVSASKSDQDAGVVARAIDLKQEAAPMDQAAVASAVAKVSNALLSDDALFEMLIRRLRQPTEGESEAERNRREIMTRHLLVMSGKPDAAVAEIDGLTTEEQEFLRHQLMGLWTIIDPEGHPVNSRRFSSALPKIREATKHLAASTDSLDVRSLTFCTSVVWFGQYKEFDENTFKKEQKVLLYCEVDNFAAKRVENGYETHLQGSYTIYNNDNRKVVSQLLPADQQISRNYLRDYFITYELSIPTQLAGGDYRLELTMEDINGQKYGQSSIRFQVAE